MNSVGSSLKTGTPLPKNFSTNLNQQPGSTSPTQYHLEHGANKKVHALSYNPELTPFSFPFFLLE
jgi:hypothetical protein